MRQILSIVIILFPLSEIMLFVIKRSRGQQTRSEDRGSMTLLWLTILLGVTLAFFAVQVRPAQIPVTRPIINPIALVLMVGGLALRWIAILTLGRFFTVDVAIHSEHPVVESGLYHFMRHPSYTGLMIAFLGFGISFGNWLSIVAMLLPITFGVINRVATEEKALVASLGPAYSSYCERTKRFIPGIF
ncbi:MAG: isoprenylcysteine carboxylmethyltransferase family protein [Acidobacteria bacterium]|nr:isoprenylcysteine carboxylmethyltransferase family protein [Acidobacteriota bacterium]